MTCRQIVGKSSSTRPQISALLVLLFCVVLVACGEDQPEDVYEARGELIGVADGGTALVVHHEEIEGLMGPMVMTLRFWSDEDQAAFADLDASRGDTIAFELIQADDMYIRNVRTLPHDVELKLPPHDDQ